MFRFFIISIVTFSPFSVFASSIYDNLTPTVNTPAPTQQVLVSSCSESYRSALSILQCDTATNEIPEYDATLFCNNMVTTGTLTNSEIIPNPASWNGWSSTRNGIVYTVYDTTIKCTYTDATNTTRFTSRTYDLLYSQASTGGGGCLTGEVEHDGSCYLLDDVIANDSCNINTPFLPDNGLNNPAVCQTQSDGSYCRFELVTNNGLPYYAPSLEPSTCHTSNDPDYVDNVTPPTGNDCTLLSSGVMACPESPLNVCDSQGICQTGCGTVTFNGVEQFLCFSPDSDNDGLGDYADPDIDGDGIPNSQDLDSNGDGIDDPDFSNTPSGSQSQLTADGISQALSGQLQETLLESASFDTGSLDSAAQTETDNFNNAVDSLLTDSNFNLSDNIDSTGFNDSLDSVTSVLTPSTCTNSITIPFTSTPLDICKASNYVRPILGFLFAIGAIYYCWIRISSTARGV